MTMHAVPAWQLRIGWNVIPDRGGAPRRVTSVRLEGVPSSVVAQFSGGQTEHFPASQTVLVDDEPQ